MLRVTSKYLAIILLAGLPVPGFGQASQFRPSTMRSDVVGTSEEGLFPTANVNEQSIPHVQTPIMAPELALHALQSRDAQQNASLGSYTDETLVMAELLDTSQRGAFELQRSFVAPRSLSFKQIGRASYRERV